MLLFQTSVAKYVIYFIMIYNFKAFNNSAIAFNLNNNFNYKEHSCELLEKDYKFNKLIEFCRKDGTIIYPPEAYKINEISCFSNCSHLRGENIIGYVNLKTLNLIFKDIDNVELNENLLNGKNEGLEVN